MADCPVDADRSSGELIDDQERVRLLLRANQAIIGELSLPVVLRRIVETARDLVGARYAALGVIGPEDTLEQFIQVGMDDETVRLIGDLPKGLGVLGALIADARPIRVSDVTADEHFAGFPEHHPPMSSFLGVPIRSRSAVFGNLYLANKASGAGFTPQDEELISALAATAGIAIENARLYEESRRRALSAQASAEISAGLLDPEEEREPLQFIADTVRRLAAADVVSLVVPTEDPAIFRIPVASGEAASELVDLHYPSERTLVALAMETGRGVRIGSAHAQPGFFVHLRRFLDVGPVMAVPLAGRSAPRGGLVVGRHRGSAAFQTADLELAEGFANQAAIAMELAAARAAQERLRIVGDRERIARDLHDHVIQRVFAAGLSLHSLAPKLADPSARDRLNGVVDDLDGVIHQLRNSIFELRDNERHSAGLRAVILHVARQITPSLGHEPRIQLSGPLDAVADQALISDVEAVVREGLTNIARHAGATAIDLSVAADARRLRIEITDNGCGLSSSSRRSGLQNLRERARIRGGDLELEEGPEGGTCLRWAVPLS